MYSTILYNGLLNFKGRIKRPVLIRYNLLSSFSQTSFRGRFPLPRYIEHIYEQIDESDDDSDDNDDDSDGDDDRYNKVICPKARLSLPQVNDSDGDESDSDESSSSGEDDSDEDDNDHCDGPDRPFGLSGLKGQASGDVSVSSENDTEESQSSEESSLSDSLSKLSLIRSLSKGRIAINTIIIIF